MKIHRGRMFTRVWPGSGNTTTTWTHRTSVETVSDERDTVMMIGVVEADANIDEHEVHGFVVNHAGETMLAMTGIRTKGEIYAASELHSLSTEAMWPRPSDTALAGGGILLRRTRVPAGQGATFTALVVMTVQPGAIADQMMVDVRGDLGSMLVIDGHADASHLNMNGSALSQLLGMPLWGWEEEPWGLTSSMELEAIDQCERYAVLMERGDPDDAAELERLRRSAIGWVFMSSERDETFQEYRRQYVKEAGRMPWDGWMSRSEIERRDAITKRIVRRLMEREDA